MPTVAASPWRVVARGNVADVADYDLVVSSDRRSLFRAVRACAVRQTVRLRRAEVQLGNRRWQRLFLPLVLEEGRCSDPIALLGAPNRVRAFRFAYEALTPGVARGTLSMEALPQVQAQPR